MKKKLYFIPIVALGASLIACGGGGEKPQPVPPKSHTVTCASSKMRLHDATAYEGIDFSTTIELNNTSNEVIVLPEKLSSVKMGDEVFTNYSYTRSTDMKTASFSIEGSYITGDIVINDDVSTLYTVTWNLDNGEDKIEETYAAGATPEFKGAVPVKEDSEIIGNYYQTGYRFDGWKDDHNQDIHPVDGDVEYKAQYVERSVVTRLVLANNALQDKTVKIKYEGTCEAVSWDTGVTLEEDIPSDTLLEHEYTDPLFQDSYTVISIFGDVTSITLTEKESSEFKLLGDGNGAIRCIILGSYVNKINSFAFSALTLLNAVYLPTSLNQVGSDIASRCDLTGKSLMFYTEYTSMPTNWDKNWAAVTISHVQNYETYYSVHTVGVDSTHSYSYISIDYNGYEELAITGFYGKMPISGELTIPNTEDVNGVDKPVTAIMYEAFKDNTELKQMTIPDTIDCIGKNTFKNCVQLGGIYLTSGGSPKWPSKLEVIEESAFQNCRKLIMDCDFSNTLLTTIGENAFRSSGVKSLKLGRRVNSIGNLAFCLSGLTTADLSAATNLTAISDSAFESTDLKDFTFPSKVKEIKSRAFASAISPQYEGGVFVLPETITSIGSEAFTGLPSAIALDATAYEDAASIPAGVPNMLGSGGGYNNTIYVSDTNLKDDFLDKNWPANANYILKPTF